MVLHQAEHFGRLVVKDGFLYVLPNWLLFIIIVGGSVSLAWVGTLFMRRRTKVPEDHAHNEANLPAPFWFVLVIGAAITICFCLVLHMENVWLHAGMTALLTGLIAMCIWLIVAINHPLAGDLHISTNAFEYALHVINSLPR